MRGEGCSIFSRTSWIRCGFVEAVYIYAFAQKMQEVAGEAEACDDVVS